MATGAGRQLVVDGGPVDDNNRWTNSVAAPVFSPDGQILAVGWTGPSYYVTALSVGAVVCIAASNGGTTSQDLKTGFIVGATPRYQQIAILIGASASALLLGPILLGLNNAATVYVPASQAARASPGTALCATSSACSRSRLN